MNATQGKLSDIIAPNFYQLHRELKSTSSNYSQFWLLGGRGSLKSSTIAVEIVLGVMEDPKANAIAFRKVDATVRSSIKTTFEWAIDMLNVTHLWKSTTSPAELTYLPTGQKIILKGLDDSKKVKSIKLRKGYFKYSWFEELDEFGGMEEVRSVGQSIKRGGTDFVQFFSFNPPRDPKHWVNVHVAGLEKKAANDNKKQKKKNKQFIHKSSYLQAPRHWLGEEFFEDAEELREFNPLAYDHEYLGIATGLAESVIFNGKYAVMDFEVQPEWNGPYFGADWGFADDPLAFVKLWIEDLPNGRKNLYVEHAEFGKHVELDDIPAFFDKIEDSRAYKIYGDSARPDVISYVKRKGFKLLGAEKGPGSVEDGIDVLKTFQTIYIHTRCEEMAEEARLYSYKVDPNTKDILPIIIDKYNHGWDAIRYALVKYIKGKKRGVTTWQ